MSCSVSDSDCDGDLDATDCDDSDPNTYTGAAEYDFVYNNPNYDYMVCMTDADNDGFGDDNPAVGVEAGTDCDDSTAYEDNSSGSHVDSTQTGALIADNSTFTVSNFDSISPYRDEDYYQFTFVEPASGNYDLDCDLTLPASVTTGAGNVQFSLLNGSTTVALVNVAGGSTDGFSLDKNTVSLETGTLRLKLSATDGGTGLYDGCSQPYTITCTLEH